MLVALGFVAGCPSGDKGPVTTSPSTTTVPAENGGAPAENGAEADVKPVSEINETNFQGS